MNLQETQAAVHKNEQLRSQAVQPGNALFLPMAPCQCQMLLCASSKAVHAPQLLHQRFHLCDRLGARQLQRRLPLHAGPPQQRQEHLG